MNNKITIKVQGGPEFWGKKVGSLPERVRATVAKIVWWDHFSSRLVSERWSTLDKYLNEETIDLTQVEWQKYLTQIGYTENEAATRCIEQRGSSNSRRNFTISGRGTVRPHHQSKGVLVRQVQGDV